MYISDCKYQCNDLLLFVSISVWYSNMMFNQLKKTNLQHQWHVIFFIYTLFVYYYYFFTPIIIIIIMDKASTARLAVFVWIIKLLMTIIKPHSQPKTTISRSGQVCEPTTTRQKLAWKESKISQWSHHSKISSKSQPSIC